MPTNATLYEQARNKQGKQLAQSKCKGEHGRQGYVAGVPSLSRITSPFGEGEEHNAHTKPTRVTLFILTLLPMQAVVITLTVP